MSELKQQPFRYIGNDLQRHVLQETQIRKECGEDPGIPIHGTGGTLVREFETKCTPFSPSADAQGAKINIVQYLGIAADEPERIARHEKRSGIALPLVKAGWDEAYCRKWCEENNLLSPIYTTEVRGGCWFCHNQGVDSLRRLRKTYPDLWKIMLRWDLDSPESFRPDGHTVHDFERRFQLEDEGKVPLDRKFKWKMIGTPTTEQKE